VDEKAAGPPPETGGIGHHERAQYRDDDGGRDQQRTAGQSERQRHRQIRRVLLARGQQTESGAGHRPVLTPRDGMDGERETEDDERLGEGLLEDEQRARVEEDQKRRQLAEASRHGPREQPSRRDGERDQRVPYVAQQCESRSVQQDGERQIRKRHDPPAVQKLRRIRPRNPGTVDVRIRDRVRTEAAQQRICGGLPEHPDVDPWLRTGTDDHDREDRVAGEEDEKSRPNQRSVQVHAEVGRQDHERGQRHPAKAALERAGIAVQRRIGEQRASQSHGAAGAQHCLRDPGLFAAVAPRASERGNQRRRRAQRHGHQRPCIGDQEGDSDCHRRQREQRRRTDHFAPIFMVSAFPALHRA